MSKKPKRSYTSERREAAAAATRENVLHSARTLFTRRGLDTVTVAEVAKSAGVSVPTVYALFKSKEGLLQALMEASLFGGRYQAASARLDSLTDPVEQIATTASVARAIYESETAELGLIRGAAAFSPALRKMEQAFESLRFELQAKRVERLYAAGRAKKGVPVDRARRLLWMYTSRDVYRLLVLEGGWSPDEYEAWLSETLVAALVDQR